MVRRSSTAEGSGLSVYMNAPQALLLTFAAGAVPFDCSIDLVQALLPTNSTVFYATHYAAGANFIPPVALNGGGGPQTYVLPRSGCVVQANVSLPAETQYSMGLILPDDWNGRFLTAGNGAFSGSIRWSELVDTMWYGFATTSTNTGHEASPDSAIFAYPNKTDALINWGYRALHDTIVQAKKIVQAYYGRNITYSYFRGCSAGGRQGLNEIQMFPEDFDGVVAGAPAWWTSRVQLWKLIVGIWNYPEGAKHRIQPSQFSMVSDEVIRQCDLVDGVQDNVVMDPRACAFQPEILLCADNATNLAACLSSEQIETYHKLTSDWKAENSTLIFPGLTPGSEWGWDYLVSEPSRRGIEYVRYMLQKGPDWDWNNFDPSIVALSDNINPGSAASDDFDVSPFYRRGGKLITYHGLDDSAIPAGSSTYFYDQVTKALVREGIQLDDFHRFFLIPGMGHCSGTAATIRAPWYVAGDGQSAALKAAGAHPVHSVPGFSDPQHDILLAIMAWVENGTAPDMLIATNWNDDSRVDAGAYRQRPVCPYPSQAAYDGAGVVRKAASWSCRRLS